jgi:hypothetical protein
MDKLRAGIISGVLILIATVMMGSMYTISSKSYAYSYEDGVISDIVVNNIDVLESIDSTRVDGPNIVNNDIELELDLEPYETYKFTYDVVNNTSLDYRLNNIAINCLNDENVNDYLTVNLFYDNGTQVKNSTEIDKGTKRIVYATITYDKNVTDMKTFKLQIDQDFKPSVLR